MPRCGGRPADSPDMRRVRGLDVRRVGGERESLVGVERRGEDPGSPALAPTSMRSLVTAASGLGVLRVGGEGESRVGVGRRGGHTGALARHLCPCVRPQPRRGLDVCGVGAEGGSRVGLKRSGEHRGPGARQLGRADSTLLSAFGSVAGFRCHWCFSRPFGIRGSASLASRALGCCGGQPTVRAASARPVAGSCALHRDNSHCRNEAVARVPRSRSVSRLRVVPDGGELPIRVPAR